MKLEDNNKRKINWKSILINFSIWLIILIVIVAIGYGVGSSEKNIWPAIIVTQFAVTLIELIWLYGGFSITSSGSRGVGRAYANRKNKLGAYTEKEYKQAKKPWEIEKENKKKSRQGAIAMIILTIIESIIVLPIIL